MFPVTYSRHSWQDDAACLGHDTEEYFDRYEEDTEENNFSLRREVDARCQGCPVVRMCMTHAKYYQLTGVWGGMYMVGGSIKNEFNDHKSPDDWAKTYKAIVEQNDI